MPDTSKPSAGLTSRSNWEPKLLITMIGLLALLVVIGNVFYLVPEVGDVLEPSFEHYRYLSDSTTYSVCETLILALVIFTALLAFEQLRAGLPGAGPIMGLALVWAGATDVLHMVLTDQILSGMPTGVEDQQVDVSGWVWVVCRTFSALILLFGVVMVIKRKHAIATRGDMVAIFIVSPLLFVAAYVLSWQGATKWIPQIVMHEEVITRPWDLLPLVTFVSGAVLIYPLFYLRRRTNFTLALWLSMIPNVGAHVYLAFMSTEMFDVHFYVAQFMRVFAYATVFAGMFLDHSRVYVELKTANEDMLEAVLRHDTLETKHEETELLYTGLVESMPLAVFHKDLDGRFTYVNEKLCRLVGEEEVQLIGKSDADFFPPELAEKYRADDTAVVETGQTFEDVEKFVGGDGETIWVHVMKNALYDPSGKAIGIRGIFWDITDKVKAEQIAADERQLRHAAEDAQATTIAMYYSLIQSLPLGVFCKDREGKFTYVNERMAEMVDVGPDEMLGKTNAEVFPSDLAKKYNELDVEVIETHEVRDVTAPYHGEAKGSGFVHYVIAPQSDADGNVTGVRGFFWDVTELMEARFDTEEFGVGGTQRQMLDDETQAEQSEHASRDFEALYTSLVEALPLAAFRKDLQGRYTFANKRWCDAKGVTLGEVIGKTDHDFHPSERAEKYRADDVRVVETREPLEDIEENNDADGNTIHVHVLKSPIRNADGEVIGVQGMWWDVTSQVKAEEAAHQIESLYAALLESLPVAIFRKDAEGKYTFANKRWCDAKGLVPDGVIGKTDYDFHPAERADKFRADDQKVMTTREPFEDTEENTDASGNTIKVHVLKSPVLDRKGNVIGVQGMWWKVSDTGHVEEPDPSDSDVA